MARLHVYCNYLYLGTPWCYVIFALANKQWKRWGGLLLKRLVLALFYCRFPPWPWASHFCLLPLGCADVRKSQSSFLSRLSFFWEWDRTSQGKRNRRCYSLLDVEKQGSSPRQPDTWLPDTWPDSRGKALNILFCASLAKSELTDLYSTWKLDFKVPLGVLQEVGWPNKKIILWCQCIM